MHAVPTTRTINGKALSTDITLSASDISGIPDTSLFAPKANPVFSGGVTIGERDGTNAAYSLVIGSACKASSYYTIACGSGAQATYKNSFAFGDSAVADGSDSFALGSDSSAYTHDDIAFGTLSKTGVDSDGGSTGNIAIGYEASALGYDAVAIGKYTKALSGVAIGKYAYATDYGCAIGHAASSNTYALAIGKNNKEMTGGGSSTNTVGDAFVVGNGTSNTVDPYGSKASNALRLDYSGQLYLTKAYKSTGADYAEYFEWLDGNSSNEDRVGHFVTLEGNKIKIAQEGDFVLGIISGQPCVIGNADEDWLGRWEHDDFNRFVKEYLTHTRIEVEIPAEFENLDEKERNRQFNSWVNENDIHEQDGKYFKTETEVVDYPTVSWRHKANPNYDSSQPYIERQDRQEWDAVGMVGVLSVMDDGTCEVNSYCRVSQNGIATASEEYIPRQSFRVIARVSKNVVKVILL